MAAKLDTLPWLVLSRICDYLDDDDDDDDHVSRRGRRSDLHAFSLMSRQSCAVSASRRFCQVRMTVATAEELLRALERCADMLDRGEGGRYRYVQRLKVVRPEPDEKEEDNDEWERRRVELWRLDMPRFCRPALGLRHSFYSSKLEATTDEPWLALARLIGRLPALKDLVWGFRNMPQPVLTAVHAAGACRLHMHGFWLDSVVVSRSGHDAQVVDVDPDDYALATSPALSSIVARVQLYEDDGRLNYGAEALWGIAAGAAPNLQHVWLSSSLPSDSIPLREAVLLGRPPAAPNNLFSPNAQAGSPRSLCFSNGSGGWAARVDLSKLAHLNPGWDASSVDSWADVAARLVSLRDLTLSVDSNRAPTVSKLLKALNPNSLQSLDLGGHIDEALFNTVLDQHGQSLRRLTLVQSDADDDSGYDSEDGPPPPPPFVLTPVLVAQLAEACPNVEILQLRMTRTRGDARECAVYRALGAVPRLRRLSLTLYYTIDISEEAQEEDGPFMGYPEIPRADLSRAFADAAFDAALARSIFDLVSPGGSGRLQHLRLEPVYTAGRYHRYPYACDQRFDSLLRWLARPWVCERPKWSGGGTGTGTGTPADVEIRDGDPRRAVEAGRAWQEVDEESKRWPEEKVFIEAFGDVWPQTGAPRWWEHWTSRPLCPEEGVPVEGK